MKKLLLSCLLIAVGSTVFAQTSCATAVNITTNGTITTPTYSASSTYSPTCMASATSIRAIWYKYTPTTNGEITVSSNFTGNTNNGTTYTNDTRVSVLKGTCAALTCVDSNDDVSATNYLSAVNSVPVAAGTTYYIQWDNYWFAGVTGQGKALQFTFNFTATSCVRPGAADFYRPDSYTTTSASLYWNNSVGSPANYDIDWSVGFADAAGTGTIVPVPAGATTYTQGDITGLPESLNFRYFVRSNCGATQSAWQGPFYGYLAVPLPYSNDFDNAANNNTDGFIGFSLLDSSTTATPPISDFSGVGTTMFTPNSTTAVTNRWAYSRALSLVAGEQVTLNFKTKLYAQGATTAVSPMTLQVTVGSAQSTTAQTTLVGSVITTTDNAAFADQSVSWTAPSDGIYYFGFNNNSPIGATQTYLFLDNLDISSVLSTNSFLASKLSVYPNPSSNLINISSTVNATISLVEMADLNGRVVKSTKLNATEGQISVSDLATGVYMMKITTDQGVATKKIVKQ